MTINIVDAGCGVGKTTALINKINEENNEQKYLFITPFLTEVERIIKSCPDKNFIDPQESEKESKFKNIKNLFKDGANIVTTHSLFKKFDKDVLNIIKEQNYILVMDEVSEVIEELQISKSDLNILKYKYISADKNTHRIKWLDPTYDGKLNEYKNMIEMDNIYGYTNKDNEIISLIWLFPYKVFESFKNIYILTYMFDGQIQKKYFDYFNTNYNKLYVKDFHLTYEVQKYNYEEQKKLIKVCEKEKLNLIGWKKTDLSKAWFDRNKKSKKMNELQNNISNFFRSYAKSNNNEIIWTTFKQYKNIIRKKGFTKGFVSVNCRATNEYSKKNAVAYIANRYFKPTVKNFFTFNNIAAGQDFEDKFALSELIQFVYRSAIRNNEPIEVYIPSKRMRDLFLEWLKKPND